MRKFSVYAECWKQEWRAWMPLKDFKKTLLNGIKGYVIFLAALVLVQREFIYHPSKIFIAVAQDFGAVDVQYKTADGVDLTSWYAAPQKNKPVIIMFHGNTGNISSRAFAMNSYKDLGYGYLLVEYRGFGGNGGHISENGFYTDARASMEWLKNEKKIPENNIIIYGESIGTGVAAQMAIEYKNAKALIFEAPLKSVPDVVVSKMPWAYPAKFLVIDNYQTILKAPYFKMPFLAMAGTEDEVIPVNHSKEIFAQVGSEKKELTIFTGGHHNDLSNFGLVERVTKFLAEL